MAQNKDSIIIKNLTKRYKKLIAVDDLSLQVKKGEIFGILGPNGAGKTTLINVLSTLLKPSQGKVLVNDFDIQKNPGEVRKSRTQSQQAAGYVSSKFITN
ncbi:MAG: ATP-binding cassette domain-containing protein [archaeon]